MAKKTKAKTRRLWLSRDETSDGKYTLWGKEPQLKVPACFFEAGDKSYIDSFDPYDFEVMFPALKLKSCKCIPVRRTFTEIGTTLEREK